MAVIGTLRDNISNANTSSYIKAKFLKFFLLSMSLIETFVECIECFICVVRSFRFVEVKARVISCPLVYLSLHVWMCSFMAEGYNMQVVVYTAMNT